MKLEEFSKLGLSEVTIEALKKKGFEEPSEIQAKTIPLILKTELDVIGQAQTGTGKTAAFGLPILETIEVGTKKIQALILAPTRELAIQVSEEINSLAGNRKILAVPIYGGQSIENQLKQLRKGIDIVVGTPGRIIDHINRKSIKLDNLSYMVLDEADEMLNMGFIDDVKNILTHTNENKRTLLFSATMPKEILNIAKKYMNKYEVISTKNKQLTTNLTEQIYFEVNESDKFEALCRILDIEDEFYGVIFSRTKVNASIVAGKLNNRGYQADSLHGDLSQSQREHILQRFKKKQINILVATDVAARGIDINDLTHVINYCLPQDPEKYVHRIGRTGRAGKKGNAITFVTPEEYRLLLFIKRVANTDIKKEKIPGVAEVIDIKRSRIKAEIEKLMEKQDENNQEYLQMATSLLEDNDSVAIIASLIKHAFKNDLDYSSYTEIRDVSVDKKGTTKLFVAKGKADDITPQKLISFISEEANINKNKIGNIQIYDKFSFVSVPFAEAEIILGAFKKSKGGRRPLVDKAKPMENKSGGGNSRFGGRSGSRSSRGRSTGGGRGGFGGKGGSSGGSSSSRGGSSGRGNK